VPKLLRPLPALIVVAAITLVVRIAATANVNIDNVTPDGARFINIARCLERGQGFSTPEAWPAWMNPARLPMPETFKEPGYPQAMATLRRLARTTFGAGQLVSLLAGLLLPFAVYALGRALDPDPLVRIVASLLTAASPLLIWQSAAVMAESLAALTLVLAFVAAASRAASPRAGFLDLVAGVFLGLSFLVRAQAALALPALFVLLCMGRGRGDRLRAVLYGTIGALIAASPLFARNLRLFGTPLHSDVAAFGLWPYVDQFQLTHSLERPPSALAFALTHPIAVASYALHGTVRFCVYTLPHDVLGQNIVLFPLAVGLIVALARWRSWGFAIAFIIPTAAFILSLNWVARYFASAAPVFCLLAALGWVWMLRRGGDHRLVRGLRVWHVLTVIMLATVAVGAYRGVIHAAPAVMPELKAARAEAAFLNAHLEPGEAVMAEMTSYWACFARHNAVYPVVADSARFVEVMRRLHVRYAALETARLSEFAARYPGGRLPSALELDHENRDAGVTVFRMNLPAATP
jgi:4-amino-4-deoxy-L-arabinose transferase-like glycosyltransferase